MTVEIPAVVATTVAALRTAAGWLPDEQRELLLEAATVAENGGWEAACCPICEETWCDAGCPLEGFRNELLSRAEREGTVEPPHVLPKGSGVKLIWPGWQPFHKSAPTPEGGADDALRGYAEAKRSLAGSLREMTNLQDDGSPLEVALSKVASAAIEHLGAPTPGHTLPPWEPFRMPVPIALNPPYQRPVLPNGCYDASFGRVHVRPGCRC